MNTPFGQLILTEDGSWTIRHPGHGQDFHSLEGAKFEAWQLYIVASGIRDKFAQEIVISVLDVGMGLAYNACATIAAWLESPGNASVNLFSLELDAKLTNAVFSGEAPWFQGWTESWLAGPRGLQQIHPDKYKARVRHPISGVYLDWEILVGDADEVIQKILVENIDYIWQDPFTPELNPSMWSKAWFGSVFERSQPEAKLMTYSVSRVVRDALEAGGWSVERFDAAGRKRHWLRALRAP